MLMFFKGLTKSILPTKAYIRVGVFYLWLRAKYRIAMNKPLQPLQSELQFGVHLAEHCNLNCCGCDNFSPLAKPEFLDVAEFERDLKRLSDLFDGRCKYISLMGGEPLLHPQLIAIIEIARKHFPWGGIGITTNGILLTQMAEEFWEVCRQHNVLIQITHYPINININKIKETASKYNVTIRWASDGVLKELWFWPIDETGKNSVKLNFAMCTRCNNGCAILQHGKLCTCSLVPNIRHYTEHFQARMEIAAEDYIDIYQEQSAEAILKKLAQPIPFCRYCNVKQFSGGIPWQISKREKSEWCKSVR